MIAAMLRVKDEGRWIAEVIEAALKLCERIVVFDDSSHDDTVLIARAHGAEVIRSRFSGLDEARDKNFLLHIVRMFGDTPDWVLSIDGDEVLEEGAAFGIVQMLDPAVAAYSLRVKYLWDRRDRVRMDGVYGRFRRPSLFRLVGQPEGIRFEPTRFGGNFHCGNVPQGLKGEWRELDAALLHLGYMDREDRLRKYRWYNQQDPDNEAEDRYRHMVQGDVSEVPADAVLKHAGPLRLESL